MWLCNNLQTKKYYHYFVRNIHESTISKLWNEDATLVSKFLACFLMISILTAVGFHGQVNGKYFGLSAKVQVQITWTVAHPAIKRE